ncbi:MAG TPA: hypothetical protein VGM44_10935 [Polyangiaceae bacterium]|jgi:hypothetical protein
MSVTLSEVKRAARAHRAPLAGESAGYLVLALADQVLNAPRLIDAHDVVLTEEGALRLSRGQASSDADAELSLRRVLDELLLVASSGSAALMRAGRRTAAVGLPVLVKELEAALIPVNRAAARRALARLQRETARAVSRGTLPEWIEAPAQPAPDAIAVAPATREIVVPAVVPVAVQEIAALADEEDGETRAIPLPLTQAEPELVASPSLDGVVTTLCDEPVAIEESPSDALTVALDLRDAVAEETKGVLLLEEDVEFIDEEPSDALTLVRDVEIAPIAVASQEPAFHGELAEEACTKPEPVILRQSQRPAAPPEAPVALEPMPRTPTLGSLAAELPVLAPELIAELSRCQDEQAEELEVGDASALDSSEAMPELCACSPSSDECTEPMPEVEPLTHGVAIVASRKSDVRELLQGFQIASDDGHRELCRAIKEMAELDLTPAPFAALIR